MKFSEYLSRLFSPLSHFSLEKRQEFVSLAFFENIKRLRVIAAVGSSLHLVIFMIPVFWGGSISFTEPSAIARSAWIGISAIYIILSRNVKKPEDAGIAQSALFLSGLASAQILAAVLNGTLVSESRNITVYVIMTLISAAFFDLSALESFLVFMPGLATIIALMFSTVITSDTLISNVINAATVTLFAFAISLVVRMSSIKVFTARATIEDQKKELEHLSKTDPLTGAANRRELETSLEREWRRASRIRSPISIALFDLDFFKLYSEMYGHVAGDQCLKRIYESVRTRAMRGPDLFGRFGGDEFMLILPDTDFSGAFELTETVRKTIRDLSIPHRGSEYEVLTVSAGCASIVPDPGIDMWAFVDYADKALYAAKKNGRDRTKSASIIF